MYFITNSEGYIVAASKELLDEIGYRDICSVALALKNKQFDIDSENKEIKISDTEYLYSVSNMLSAFGELNLYNLTAKSDLTIEEDDSIEYLKKIKEGSIVKDDNNFSIPSIVSDKEEKSEDSNLEIFTKEDKETIKSEESNLEIPTLENKEEQHHSDENLEISIVEKKEEIKSDDNKLEIFETEHKEEKVDKSVANLLKDIEEIEVPTQTDDEVVKPEIVQEDVTPIDSDIKVENILSENVDITESKESEKEEKSALSKIKSKLFPWSGDTEDKEIELEESPKDKLEFIEESEEETSKNIEDSLEKEIAKSVEERVEVEDLDSKLPSNIPEVKEEHLIEGRELEVKDESKKIEEIIPKVELFDDSSKTVDLLNVKDEKLGEDIEEDKSLDDSIAEIEKEISKVQSEHEDKIELSLEDRELEILKEIDEIEVKKEPESIEPISLTSKEETSTVASDSVKEKKVAPKQDFLHKIISMQVDSINLEENAKKLSIDLTNYKLLLENFLDELDNYKSDLEGGENSTISMLMDASELLSLNTVTDKLKKLLSGNSSAVNEINLTKELLRDKLNSSEKNSLEVKTMEVEQKEGKTIEEEPLQSIVEPEAKLDTHQNIVDETILESKEKIDTQAEPNISTPPIPEEAIDITTDSDLLAKVTLTKIDFDPERAVNELNLPKTLILEFVNDFISQAKDHLGQLVDAYKQSDLKTLQTTAHMLKGAASNLRLDPIAEVLFKIQKSNNIEESGELLKKFVANLKGLEYEVDNFEKESNED